MEAESTLPNMTFRTITTCEGCKKDVEVYDIEINIGDKKGEWIEWKKGCICEDLKLARNAVQRRDRLIVKRSISNFDKYSLINRDLMKANMENFNPESRDQEFARDKSISFIEGFDLENPSNLLFHGRSGVGKSHLAKSIADKLMERGYTTIFISLPKLLRKIRSTYSGDAKINEDKLFSILVDVDLLVLDDIGAEGRTDWATERIFDLIDSRQGKSTLYTTNYDVKGMLERFGERDFSRILNDDSTAIFVSGENYRLRKFKGDK